MENKILLTTLFAIIVVAGRETNAATFFSTHGPRGPSILASSPFYQSRLKIRQAATAQQPQAYAVPQQPQQQQEAQAAPPNNFLYYPQNVNPQVSAQLTGQNPLQFPQVQTYDQYTQQQQAYQLQQLQEIYQQQQQQQQQQYQQLQQQPQYQQIQQQPAAPANQLGLPYPGGVRYVFASPGRNAARITQNQPQVVEEQAAAEPAQPAPGQLGVAFSPATSVASIKFSNPYANYSY